MSSYKRKRDTTLAVYRPFRPQYKRYRRVPSAPRVLGRYAREGELKFHDVDLDDAVVANAGTVTPSINLIAQGISESERIGRKCTIKLIQWRFRNLVPEVDAIPTPNSLEAVRMIMYQDKQCNGATATVTGILKSADLHSFYNLSNGGRFNILCDKIVELNYQTLASDNAAVVSQGVFSREGTFTKRCNIPLEFDAEAGILTEIRSNNLGVLLISNSAIAGFNSKIRLRFSDGS